MSFLQPVKHHRKIFLITESADKKKLLTASELLIAESRLRYRIVNSRYSCIRNIPSYFIFLECDPTLVDVNIHPQKTEVKFTQEHIIFEILTACVRESLGRNAFTPSIDFSSGEILDFPPMERHVGDTAAGGGGFGAGYSRPSKMDYSPLFPQLEKEDGGDGRFTTPSAGYGPLLEESAPEGSNIILLGGLILVPVKDSLAVINIKKAQEAILYHKYFEFLSQEKFISQRSLYPQQVTLQSNIYSLVLEHMDRISQLGFDVRDFGDNTIIVYAVPDGFPADEDALKEAMDNLAAMLEEDPGDEVFHSYASSLAKAAAGKLSHSLNAVQAGLLADQVLVLRATYGADLAARCIAFISKEELERKI